MNIRKSLFASMGAAALMLGSAALAQDLTAGATVMGPEGGEVGTISSVEGDFVVLKTDRHEVRLPASSFTASEEGVLFGMTREQVNAQADQMLAEADAALVAGALVRDPGGVVVGPIAEVGEDFVDVTVGNGLVRLPRNAVAPGPEGPVVSVPAGEIRARVAVSPE